MEKSPQQKSPFNRRLRDICKISVSVFGSLVTTEQEILFRNHPSVTLESIDQHLDFLEMAFAAEYFFQRVDSLMFNGVS